MAKLTGHEAGNGGHRQDEPNAPVEPSPTRRLHTVPICKLKLELQTSIRIASLEFRLFEAQSNLKLAKDT